MDFKFNKDGEGGQQQESTAEKGRQSVLLVVLLILVAGFAYIYYFTGLIRPQQTPKPAEAPAPQVVKNPLPPRDGDTAKAAAPPAPEAPKAAATALPVKPATPAATQNVPAPVDKKEQKGVMAKVETNKPPAGDKKSAVTADKKVPAATDAGKKAVAAKVADKDKSYAVAVKPKKTAAAIEKRPVTEKGEGRWSIQVGNYLLEDAMAVDMARVRKAGFEVAVKSGVSKKAPMNRLFLAEYADRNAAQTELARLKRYTSDAFILEHGGKFSVYAGSYLLDDRVSSEKERLSALGFSLTLKRVEVSIPSRSLTVGSFGDKKSAEAALKKLSAAGLKATLVR